ncbi:hypothetical protein L9F63_012874, partial [Diploptera punctata]
NVNGVNVIGLALQGPSVPGVQLVHSAAARSPSALDIGYTYQHPLQARGPTRSMIGARVHDVETSLPLLTGARALMGSHVTPHAAATTVAAAAATATSLPPLQPRAATTGSTDIVFPLQPRLFPAILPAAFAELQETTIESLSHLEQKKESETITASMDTHERF